MLDWHSCQICYPLEIKLSHSSMFLNLFNVNYYYRLNDPINCIRNFTIVMNPFSGGK